MKNHSIVMRLARLYLLLMLALLITVATAEAQLPRIDSFSAQVLARSGRLRIFGGNFGSGGSASQVLIDGHSAIVSRWSVSQITAYVPEQTEKRLVSFGPELWENYLLQLSQVPDITTKSESVGFR